MKYIITDRQLRVLTEQPESRFGPEEHMSHSERQDFHSGNPERAGAALMSGSKKQMDYIHSLDPHTVATVFAIGTAFIPLVGPFISAGIGLADAALYYKEGDKTSAGITAAFSMIPFIGMIPGVKELGSKAMAALGSKVAKGIKVFTPAETKVLNAIKQNEATIKKGLESAGEKLTPVVKSVESLKPAYVKRFGQESYDNLLRDFLSGKADKQYFLRTLKTAQKASPNLANFVTKFGIKFAKDEVSQIIKVAKNAFSDEIQTVVLQTKSGPKVIKVYTVPLELVEKNLPANATANMFADSVTGSVYIVKDNAAKLSGKQIEDILVHEFAHIKDPSIVKSTKFIDLYNTKASQGIKDWATATELRNANKIGTPLKSIDDKIAKLEKSGMQKYYLNPNEIIANNTMVIQNLATNTSNLRNVMKKEQILKGLDSIIDFAKGKSTNWSEDASKLLGYSDEYINAHFQNLSTKPAEYRKLWVKLAQQAEYLKSQIKLAM